MTGKFEICWCELCGGFFVRCPRCGNNSCNGGYGEDGKCPVCPLAYEVMYALSKPPEIDKLVTKLLFADEGSEYYEKQTEKEKLGELLECHCENCESCRERAKEKEAEDKAKAAKKNPYYCCTADFGEHDPSCKNYVPPPGEDLA
jgi:hypothetical protein